MACPFWHSTARIAESWMLSSGSGSGMAGRHRHAQQQSRMPNPSQRKPRAVVSQRPRIRAHRTVKAAAGCRHFAERQSLEPTVRQSARSAWPAPPPRQLARAAVARSAGAAAATSDSGSVAGPGAGRISRRRSPCGEPTCARSDASSVTDEARTAPTTSGSSSRVASPSYGVSTRIWDTPASPTSLQVWIPSPFATTFPVARSRTEICPRISERMPSAVQKKAPRLGRASILKLASLSARSTIELEATTSSHKVLINAAHSCVGGSSSY